MESIALTVLEKRALSQGLASQYVRLKAGRIVWDELDAELPPAHGDEARDCDRLYAFKIMVEARPYYEKRALKEWLRAQVNTDSPDVIGGDAERSQMFLIYSEHLALISKPQF